MVRCRHYQTVVDVGINVYSLQPEEGSYRDHTLGGSGKPEREEFLVVRVNGYVEIGVLQVDNYEPVSLGKQSDNRVQCKHAEFASRYETVG